MRLDRREPTPTGEQAWHLTPKVDPRKGWNGRWDEERTLRVLDPGLDEAELGSVTDQLAQIMRDGIDAEPGEPGGEDGPGGIDENADAGGAP